MAEAMTPAGGFAGRRRVLVVCKGNTCRSPAAAAVITELSGGTLDVALRRNPRPARGRTGVPLMVEAMAAAGYDLSGHRSTLLDTALVDWADDLVAADEETARAVAALAGPGRAVRLLGSGIPDPWGGDVAEYARAVRRIQQAAREYCATRERGADDGRPSG